MGEVQKRKFREPRFNFAVILTRHSTPQVQTTPSAYPARQPASSLTSYECHRSPPSWLQYARFYLSHKFVSTTSIITNYRKRNSRIHQQQIRQRIRPHLPRLLKRRPLFRLNAYQEPPDSGPADESVEKAVPLPVPSRAVFVEIGHNDGEVVDEDCGGALCITRVRQSSTIIMFGAGYTQWEMAARRGCEVRGLRILTERSGAVNRAGRRTPFHRTRFQAAKATMTVERTARKVRPIMVQRRG